FSVFYDSETRAERAGASSHAILVDAVAAGSHDDDATADQAISWIRENAGRTFFVSLDLQGSHFPYAIPAESERPFQPCAVDGVTFADFTKSDAVPLKNAYHNALRNSDRVFGRVVAELERLGILDEVILVAWSDHGEGFREVEGSVTHGREPYEAASRVPF